jgi:hypothetical protein
VFFLQVSPSAYSQDKDIKTRRLRVFSLLGRFPQGEEKSTTEKKPVPQDCVPALHL